MVGARYGDGEFRLVAVVGVFVFPVLGPERAKVQGDAGCRELAEATKEPCQTWLVLLVERHNPMISILQDLADEPAECCRWPDLDKRANAAVVHGFDHLDESNRAGQLAAELGPHGVDLGWVRLGCFVGEDRDLWGVERDGVEELCERRAGTADDG